MQTMSHFSVQPVACTSCNKKCCNRTKDSLVCLRRAFFCEEYERGFRKKKDMLQIGRIKAIRYMTVKIGATIQATEFNLTTY